MTTFKIQKIRSCVQCGTILGHKCKSCVSHPDRKPKIIELYDWPKILETCPSGDCIKIQCQRDGCHGTMWRSLTHTKGGKMRSESMYCSRRCNCLVLAREKDSRVEVPCGWCSSPVLRKRSQIKTFKAAYCRPDHYFLAIRKNKHEEKETEIAMEENLALMECRGSCRDITEHRMALEATVPGGKRPNHGSFTARYRCLACGTSRDGKTIAVSAREAMAMRLATRAVPR